MSEYPRNRSKAMNESVQNLTNCSVDRSEMGDQMDAGHMMSSVDSIPSVSMMQSTVLTDLQLIYMLQQQQQQQHGGAGEATMMLSPGSLPLLMSSCQVMALHPSVSQQFVSSSSTGTSPSSLARSPLLVPDGSIVWHSAANDDQLSDNFDEDHHQGTSFSQHPAQGNGGLGQQTASPVVVSRGNALLANSHPQLLTVNGGLAAYPGYSVVNAASTSGGFVTSAPAKIVVAATPAKTSLAAPKKPLTPYMKFSKSIWQHVKNANPALSVCEVGASIGRLWREMIDTDKQKYNDEFQREKAVYEVELQTYLRATGLQVSDLTKSKKKDTRDRSKANATGAAQTLNQNYAKTVMALPLSNSSPAALVGGREGDTESATGRLPHIAQMWSGHSVTQQPAQATSQGQNILKIGANPFDGGRLKVVDGSNQSELEQDDAHSSPGGAAAAVVSNQLPSGMSWTWMKAVDPVTHDPSRSHYSLDGLDSSQSAYVREDQGRGPGAIANQQQPPVVEFYSASEGLEPGEVVVDGLHHQQPMLMAKVSMSSSSLHNGSIAVASAHNMYNSYAVNPWNRYRVAATGGVGPKPAEAIFDREHILHTELVHLRGSLSEKTKEVEQLSKELEIAYELINRLQEQDNPSQSGPQPGEAIDATLLMVGQQDGRPENQEASREQIFHRDRNIGGESAVQLQDLKMESNPVGDAKPIGPDWREVANTFPRGRDDSLSTRMPDGGIDSDLSDPTPAENSSEELNVAPNLQASAGTIPEYSTPGRSYQLAMGKAGIATEQRFIVAQFPDQRNVVMLQFESNMQSEEQDVQQNREVQVKEEAVARNRLVGISDETEATNTSCFASEELKDSGEEEMVVSGHTDMVLPP